MTPPTKDRAAYYFLSNAHSDVLAATDENGKIVASWEYDSFGSPKEYQWVYDVNGTLISKEEVPVGTPPKSVAGKLQQSRSFASLRTSLYASYYYDTETGLYYLNARYYDPKIGRFISRDPDGGDSKDRLSLNPYAYCSNNPLTREDPDGHLSFWQRLKQKYQQAKRQVQRVVRKVSTTVKKTYSKVVKTVSKVKKAIVSGAKAVGRAVARTAVKAIQRGGEVARGAVRTAVSAVRAGVSAAMNVARAGVNTVASTLNPLASRPASAAGSGGNQPAVQGQDSRDLLFGRPQSADNSVAANAQRIARGETIPEAGLSEYKVVGKTKVWEVAVSRDLLIGALRS